MAAHNTQELKPELEQRLHLETTETSEAALVQHSNTTSIKAQTRHVYRQAVVQFVCINAVTVCIVYLWVSRHKTVDIVVDLLEHKASVHQVETALQKDGKKQITNE